MSVKSPTAQIVTTSKTSFINKKQKTEVYQEKMTEKLNLSQGFRAVVVSDFEKPLAHHVFDSFPELNEDEVLVKNKFLGLNPIDWKAKKYRFGIYHFPWINGRESSGVVVMQGDGNVDLLGKRVFISSTSYRDNRTSTFQEYSVMKKSLVWQLPDFITDIEGATIGVGLVTSSIIIKKSFGLKLEKMSDKNVLIIWGGSTVVGMYLAQLAKYLGLEVIVISSLQNKSYLSQEIKVDKVVDRNQSLDDIKKDIFEHLDAIGHKTGIKYGVDCVSKETSYDLISILTDERNTIDSIPEFVGVVAKPRDVHDVNIKDLVIKRFHEDIDFGAELVQETSKLLNRHIIKPVRYKHFSGGLESVPQALQELEATSSFGGKFVVQLLT
ncbi:uncharacterized protein PRCAT00003538001 [Priceomyces carsonii]|uniref:uncharacterized protein n=1 Tax=Priceomyces carsonii TaxID=28549 RepID=UPI002EDAF5CA|nr:unnamed protein product [Priceomyces carsonii]